ncbi:MAG: GntR family transcriptional regulator [Acidobacteriaceae bacterium]
MRKLSAPRNLTTLAYDSIKRHILEGRLDEETRLTEEFLSNRLGISKSPVREALNSLQTEGLIHIEPRRGARLRQFSVQEVKNLYDLRENLEVFAVSRAHVNPSLISELGKSVERTRRFVSANDKNKHIEEDTRFHNSIAAATGNDELCRVLKNIQDQIWLCRCKTYNLSSSSASDAHLAILKAFEDDDRKGAQAAMRSHIQHVRDRLVDFLESSRPEAAVNHQ